MSGAQPHRPQARGAARRMEARLWQWLRGSLRRQLLVLLLPALTAMMAIDTWLTYHALREAANAAYDRSLFGSVRAIDNAIGMAGESVQLTLPDAAMEMFETAAQSRVFYRIALERDGALETVTGYEDLPLPSARGGEQLPNNTPRYYDAIYRGEAVRIAALARPVYRPDARMRVIIQVAESAHPRATLVAAVWRNTLARDALLIAASAAILIGGISLVLAPLGRVRDEVEARSPDDLTPLDTATVPAEVRPLVEAVNRHVGRSARMTAAQAQFIADAAHQLRTPLAIVKTQAEYAGRQLDAGQDLSSAREAIAAVVAQLGQAARLTTQLLTLARLRQHAAGTEQGQGDPRTDALPVVDAAALARQVALDYLPLARARQQDFGWEEGAAAARAGRPAREDRQDQQQDQQQDQHEDRHPRQRDGKPQPLWVRADPALLREAYANLVHNAIQYCPRRGHITLRAQAMDLHVCLSVEDDGPGIPPQEREKVFARFYRRVGTEQSGSGLGLAISREMAAHAGGAVVLEDGPGGRGLRATLRLPMAAAGPIEEGGSGTG